MHHVHIRATAPPPADVLVRWTARFWSVATVAFVVAFIAGEGIYPSAVHEWIGLVFFPFGVCVGMLVAWRFEAAGGMITVASLVLFYILSAIATGQFPAGWAFLAFSAPG